MIDKIFIIAKMLLLTVNVLMAASAFLPDRDRERARIATGISAGYYFHFFL